MTFLRKRASMREREGKRLLKLQPSLEANKRHCVALLITKKLSGNSDILSMN